jgi:hypothetical protein
MRDSRSGWALFFSLLALGFTAAIVYIVVQNLAGVTQAITVPASAYVDALSVVTGQAAKAPKVA